MLPWDPGLRLSQRRAGRYREALGVDPGGPGRGSGTAPALRHQVLPHWALQGRGRRRGGAWPSSATRSLDGFGF